MGVGRAERQHDTLGAVCFAETARSLADAAERAGLVAPAFRSPPRRPGFQRTIRRSPVPAAVGVVSVRFRGRCLDDVATDMVEGVLVANRVSERDAPALRVRLVAEVTGRVSVPPAGRHAA